MYIFKHTFSALLTRIWICDLKIPREEGYNYKILQVISFFKNRGAACMLFSTNENIYPPTHHGKIIWQVYLKKYYKRESNGLIWILSIEAELQLIRYMNTTEKNHNCFIKRE